MRMVDLIQSRSKAEWVVCSVRLGLRASSLAMASGAVTAFRSDYVGEGLIYLGLAMAQFIFAASDLPAMWNARHMNIMCAARANPTPAQSSIGAWIAYLLIISGIILQFQP